MAPLHEAIFARTVSLMLLGAWIWRSGLLENIRRHRTSLLAFGLAAVATGLALTAADSVDIVSHNRLLELIASHCAPSVQALGYAALVAVGMNHPQVGRFLRLFAPLGRMAFTNYICQSLVFCWIFFGYGLGEFGHLTVTSAFTLGVAVYLLQVIVSTFWLRSFRFGPLEWLWRSLMYGQPQGFRRDAPKVLAPRLGSS
jgi:uncharacterized protein